VIAVKSTAVEAASTAAVGELHHQHSSAGVQRFIAYACM
jgi:hypothetical protein